MGGQLTAIPDVSALEYFPDRSPLLLPTLAHRQLIMKQVGPAWAVQVVAQLEALLADMVVKRAGVEAAQRAGDVVVKLAVMVAQRSIWRNNFGLHPRQRGTQARRVRRWGYRTLLIVAADSAVRCRSSPR